MLRPRGALLTRASRPPCVAADQRFRFSVVIAFPSVTAGVPRLVAIAAADNGISVIAAKRERERRPQLSSALAAGRWSSPMVRASACLAPPLAERRRLTTKAADLLLAAGHSPARAPARRPASRRQRLAAPTLRVLRIQAYGSPAWSTLPLWPACRRPCASEHAIGLCCAPTAPRCSFAAA